MEAETKGEKELKKVIEKRLADQTVNFYEPIQRQNLETFTSVKKTVKVKDSSRVIQLIAQSDILGKVFLIQQNRNIDLKAVFCHPLHPVPWALAAGNGELMKTDKSKLMHEPEKGMTSSDSVPKPFVSIFDGMALVRKFSCAGLTYNEFADDLLKFAVASSLGSKLMDIVFDVYRESSMKNAERGHRSTGALQFKNIVGSSQIKQWGAFLSNGRNKAEMIRFLVRRWQSNGKLLGEAVLYVAYDKCICIEANDSRYFNADLECNHKEPETRMLLHAQHICQTTENIVIYAPDTDVLVIAIAVSAQVPDNCLLELVRRTMQGSYLIEKLKQSMVVRCDFQDTELLSKSLLSLQAFTGCDTVSAFCGKGKVKPLKVMLKN